jgi:hypothetical protein
MSEPEKPAEQGTGSAFLDRMKAKVVNSVYYQGTIGLLQEDKQIVTKELPAKEAQVTGEQPAATKPKVAPASPQRK